MSLLQVGSYTIDPETQIPIIDREYYGQGYIVKDQDAFLNHPDKICYVAELSDETYTRADFLELCNQQEDFAYECFRAVDWQHPETWIEEALINDEWGECESCNKLYRVSDDIMLGEPHACPTCGRKSTAEQDALTDWISLLDKMKRRELQLAFIGEADAVHKELQQCHGYGKENAAAYDRNSLHNRIVDVVDALDASMSLDLKMEMDQGEYSIYIGSGKYWNEVDLPPFTDHYFRLFRQVMGYGADEEKPFMLDLYDLSDGTLSFATETEAKEFMANECDPGPATLLKREPETNYATEVWSW